MRPERPESPLPASRLPRAWSASSTKTKQRPEGLQQAEDLFQIAFGAADPLVAEVLQLHHRHARFAGQAFDHEGLAGADRAAEQIAHRQGRQIDSASRARCPGAASFDCLLPVEVVERARRFDELDQPVAVFLDQLLFQLDEVVGPEHCAGVLAGLQQGLDRAQRRAGELLRHGRQLAGVFLQREG